MALGNCDQKEFFYGGAVGDITCGCCNGQPYTDGLDGDDSVHLYTNAGPEGYNKTCNVKKNLKGVRSVYFAVDGSAEWSKNCSNERVGYMKHTATDNNYAASAGSFISNLESESTTLQGFTFTNMVETSDLEA